MKNLVKLLSAVVFSVLGVFFLRGSVFAESVEVGDLTTFKSYATYGGDIKLVSDINISSNTFVKSELILDLNGYSLEVANGYKLIVDNGTLTINDSSSDNSGAIRGNSNYYFRIGNANPGTVYFNNGTIYRNYGVHVVSGDFIMNGGKITGDDTPVLAQGGNFTMNDGLVEASTGIALRGYSPDSTITVNGGRVVTNGDDAAINSSKGSNIIVNGGSIEALYPGSSEGSGGIGIIVYRDGSATINGGKVHSASFALASNGSNEDGNNSSGNNAAFTISGGELISDKHTAIYAPQFDGNTTISGGTITGKTTAIEIRAGDLTITGGILTALNDTFEVVSETSGTTTKGAAVAIAQHTTKNEMNIRICGGTFRGAVALSESNVIGNSPEDIAKISLLIDKPCGELVFESTSDETVISEDFTGFIKGGIYSHPVTQYVADGYIERSVTAGIEVINPEDIVPDETNPNTSDSMGMIAAFVVIISGTMLGVYLAKKR